MNDLHTQFAEAAQACRTASEDRKAALLIALNTAANHPKFPKVFEAVTSASIALNAAHAMQRQIFEQIQMERKKS